MKDSKIASILNCFKHGRISVGNAIDDLNSLFGQSKVIITPEKPIRCLDYLKGHLRCERQCSDCRNIK